MEKIFVGVAKRFLASVFVAMILLVVACGDNGSSASSDDDSSSLISNEKLQSSSSKKNVSSSSSKVVATSSSSSVRSGGNSHSSSSAKSSSSSSANSSSSKEIAVKSSSSAAVKSSSSEASVPGSSSRDENSSSSANSSSSLSVHERLTEIYGECKDDGIAFALYQRDRAGNWYTCYLGEWSEGFIEVDRYPWEPPQESFLNPNIEYGELVDSRDGKVYKTVQIGEQVWMAENLRYADSATTPSLKGRTSCYKDRPEMCDHIGLFYTWAAAIDSVKLATDPENPLDCGYEHKCGITGPVQGICPEGWHLPTMDECDALSMGARYTPADYTPLWMSSDFRSLRSSVGWESCWIKDGCFSERDLEHLGNKDNTNTTGFSAIPAGYRFPPKGDSQSSGYSAYFWTSTEYEMNYAGIFSLDRNGCCGTMEWKNAAKVFATNVRCIKD